MQYTLVCCSKYIIAILIPLSAGSCDEVTVWHKCHYCFITIITCVTLITYDDCVKINWWWMPEYADCEQMLVDRLPYRGHIGPRSPCYETYSYFCPQFCGTPIMMIIVSQSTTQFQRNTVTACNECSCIPRTWTLSDLGTILPLSSSAGQSSLRIYIYCWPWVTDNPTVQCDNIQICCKQVLVSLHNAKSGG